MPGIWIGKLVGAILGLMKGGIVGLVFGALVGHFIDRWIAQFRGLSDTRDSFFRALFTCMGHLAKADGRVSETEIQATRTLFARMSLSAREQQRAIGYFNEGKRDPAAVDQVLKTFAGQTRMRPDLRQVFMDILVQMALADGGLVAAEKQVLSGIASPLGISAARLEALIRARSGFGGAGAGAVGTQKMPVEQAYQVLGLEPKASDHEVKRAYRKLMSRYHPDKLVAQGLPEEMQQIAKSRAQEVGAAYDVIQKSRGKP